MHIIDGKKTAAIIRQELKDQVAVLTARHGRAPGLAVILVGGDPASQVYVRNKERACEDVGIISKGFRLPEDIPQAQLEDTIMFLNSDPAIDGLLLPLPLPKGLDSPRCLDLISPSKDVDAQANCQPSARIFIPHQYLLPLKKRQPIA